MRKQLKWLAGAAIALTLSSQASAVIMLNGGVYLEDFDSMGATGTAPPMDWSVTSSAGTNPPNLLGLPSSSIGGIGNNGYNAGLPVGSTAGNTGDRSLGVFGGAVGDRKEVLVAFVNNTGSAVGSFSVFYDLEAWYSRFDSATPRGGGFSMQYSTDGVSFVDMGNIFDAAVTNASVTTNGGVWLNSPISQTNIGGLYTPTAPLANGDTFFLRWNGRDGEPEPVAANSRHLVISVDNFSIDFGQSTAGPVIPEPATAGLAILTIGALAGRRRRQA